MISQKKKKVSLYETHLYYEFYYLPTISDWSYKIFLVINSLLTQKLSELEWDWVGLILLIF